MRSPRYLLAWAGACTALFVAVLAVAYYLPSARHADVAAVRDFGAFHSPLLHKITESFALSCDWYVYLFSVAALLILAYRRRGPRVTAAAATLLVGANLSSQVLKQLLAHQRDHPAPHWRFIADAAYPSGHSTAAMALAAAAVLVVPRAYRPLATLIGAAYTLSVSYSILHLGWHFVSDIIGGFLLATAWSLVALAGLRAAAQRWPVEGGMRSAARRVVADWRVTIGAVAVGSLLVAAVALTRVEKVVTYASTHTSFVVAVTGIAMSAALLLAGLAALTGRRG